MAQTPSDIHPAEYNLVLTRGATETRVFTWTDPSGVLVNLLGYTARMQIRPEWLIPGTTPDTALVSLTDKSGIVLGGSAGTVTVTITDTQTAALTIDRGVYDLELVAPSGAVTKFLRGTVLVLPEATV